MEEEKLDIRMTIRINRELEDKVKQMAKENKIKPTTQARIIIEKYLEIVDKIK